MPASKDAPRPEYPRPQFVRTRWLNLNGQWQFEIDHGRSGQEQGWAAGRDFAKTILVPFPPESALSGIAHKDFMPAVWYRRHFRLPDNWRGRRTLIHFGAVDYEAAVWGDRHAGFNLSGQGMLADQDFAPQGLTQGIESACEHAPGVAFAGPAPDDHETAVVRHGHARLMLRSAHGFGHSEFGAQG